MISEEIIEYYANRFQKEWNSSKRKVPENDFILKCINEIQNEGRTKSCKELLMILDRLNFGTHNGLYAEPIRNIMKHNT